MSGVLPGVECARRRRLHHSGGGSSYSPSSMLTRDSTERSFCLYIRNIQSSISSSSLLERRMLNQAYPDENLGGPAREAKRRLDQRLRYQLNGLEKSGLSHVLQFEETLVVDPSLPAHRFSLRCLK